MFVNMVVVRIALLTPVMKVPAQETRSGAPTEPAASSMATENARANGAIAATSRATADPAENFVLPGIVNQGAVLFVKTHLNCPG